jgi:hypothetical protein
LTVNGLIPELIFWLVGSITNQVDSPRGDLPVMSDVQPMHALKTPVLSPSPPSPVSYSLMDVSSHYGPERETCIPCRFVHPSAPSPSPVLTPPVVSGKWCVIVPNLPSESQEFTGSPEMRRPSTQVWSMFHCETRAGLCVPNKAREPRQEEHFCKRKGLRLLQVRIPYFPDLLLPPDHPFRTSPQD